MFSIQQKTKQRYGEGLLRYISGSSVNDHTVLFPLANPTVICHPCCPHVPYSLFAEDAASPRRQVLSGCVYGIEAVLCAIYWYQIKSLAPMSCPALRAFTPAATTACTRPFPGPGIRISDDTLSVVCAVEICSTAS